MKQLLLAAICSLFAFLSSNVLAEEYSNNRLSIESKRDADGKLTPDIFLPINWSDNWFSGIGFRETNQFSAGVLDGFSESKIGTLIDDRRTQLNLLSYESRDEGLKYSVGADLRQINISKNEFGYFHLIMTNPAINDWIAFDNRIKIGMSSLAMRGDLTVGGAKDSPYMLRIGANISPASKLDVAQETDFRPIVNTTGTSNSSNTQKLSWELTLDARYRLTNWMSLGMDARYDVLPLKYQIAQLSTTLNSFTMGNVDSTEVISRIGAKFIFKIQGMALLPLIGVANESTTTKDNILGSKIKTSRKLVLLGMTGQI